MGEASVLPTRWRKPFDARFMSQSARTKAARFASYGHADLWYTLRMLRCTEENLFYAERLGACSYS